MGNQERHENDSDFKAQLPSVLMTVLAVSLIVFVNARSPGPVPARSVQDEAVHPAARNNGHGEPQAALVPLTVVRRASLPL